MEDIRRGAITEIYRKSNRELAAEVDRLKALVRKMGDCLQFYATRGGGTCQEILNRPEVKAIIGGVMDTIDRREWLYTQSDDAVVDEFCFLENQLAAQTALLKDCLEVVREQANDYYSSNALDTLSQKFCAKCHSRNHHHDSCIVAFAETLLPRLEAATDMEAK